MGRIERGAARLLFGRRRNAVTVGTLTAAAAESSATEAMKLSAVNRAIEVRCDSMAKMSAYVIHRDSREREDHPILELLNLRPNEAMTPSVVKAMVEGNRLTGGNGYEWILRDPRTGTPREIIPVPWQLVTPWKDKDGHIWYDICHPLTGEPLTVNGEDMIHLKAFSGDGLKGISVLRRAAEVISAGRAAQQYQLSYYANGGQPSGILQTESDLKGTMTVKKKDGTTETVSKKDVMRREWEKIHSGSGNAHRIAILDLGLKYQPISVSQADAQFVESAELTVADIGRFFGVPLYKLMAGKESYQANSQQSVEYVVSTLHPAVKQKEEEETWKLLSGADIRKGLRIGINMMAELRGDFASRGEWYRVMSDIGAYSVNDILQEEDRPAVEGGGERRASLNYVPLSSWAELSRRRNGGENTGGGTE